MDIAGEERLTAPGALTEDDRRLAEFGYTPQLTMADKASTASPR